MAGFRVGYLMQLLNTPILTHEQLSGGYYMLRLEAPAIAAVSFPGQFIHLRIPNMEESALRRPFSICDASNGVLAILYKVVGRGTESMARLQPGDTVNIMGPLGNTFPVPAEGATPLLVAGGFGVAPLLFLARTLNTRGILFVGGRSAADVLLVGSFAAIDWETRVCTDDGSLGTRGFVTAALDAWHSEHPDKKAELYCCGPDPLLAAVDERAGNWNMRGWLSLDRRMGCGVGACLACVQKMRRLNAEGTEEIFLARACTEGPIFETGMIVWEG